MHYNVLSIDWDYFADADESFRLEYFPDVPQDEPKTLIQRIVWDARYSSYYAMKGKSMRDTVKLRVKEYNSINRLIRKRVPIGVIAESHKYMYTTVRGLLDPDKNATVSVYNIDFHHDIFDAGVQHNVVHCGNWVTHLYERFDSRLDYRWCGKDSEQMLEEFYTERMSGWSTFDLEDISETDFYVVFLCRSDMWSPPHLDPYFRDLADCINDYCDLTDNLLNYTPRPWDEHGYDNILQMKEVITNENHSGNQN